MFRRALGAARPAKSAARAQCLANRLNAGSLFYGHVPAPLRFQGFTRIFSLEVPV